MNTQTFAANDIIIAEGTYGSQTFLIKEGTVMICKETGKKGRMQIALLSEGEVFGEMYLLDDAGSRSASVIAQTPVTVEIIDKQEIEQHLAATPPIVFSILKTLSSRLAQMSQENTLLKLEQSKNPLNKLLQLLKD